MAENKKDKYNVSFEDSLENDNKVASNTDCTGLVQSPPLNSEQSNSYSELHNIPKPQDYKNKQLS